MSFVTAFEAVRMAIGLTQKRVAQLHGVSTRTVERWAIGDTAPSLHDRRTLLYTLREAPRPLLEDLARASGTTLEAAGVAPVAARDPVPLPANARRGASEQQLASAVLCAVAEAADTSPKAVRKLVIVAFRAAQSAGLTVEDVLRGLEPSGRARR